MLTATFVALGMLLASSPAGPELISISDGRLVQKPAAVADAELALLRREVRGLAGRLWAKRTDSTEIDCPEAFSVRDVASGAFSRAGANQRVFLYRYCEAGAWFARNGIAVVEDQRVVAHIVYDGSSWEDTISLVPDLDGDGLSEIAVAGGGTVQGETSRGVVLFGWSRTGVKKFGQLEAYWDDCATGHSKRAYRLLAQPGTTPSFFQQEYAGSCKNDRWNEAGPLKPIAPARDKIKYRLLPE